MRSYVCLGIMYILMGLSNQSLQARPIGRGIVVLTLGGLKKLNKMLARKRKDGGDLG